jgi:hypothetical protein
VDTLTQPPHQKTTCSTRAIPSADSPLKESTNPPSSPTRCDAAGIAGIRKGPAETEPFCRFAVPCREQARASIKKRKPEFDKPKLLARIGAFCPITGHYANAQRVSMPVDSKSSVILVGPFQLAALSIFLLERNMH